MINKFSRLWLCRYCRVGCHLWAQSQCATGLRHPELVHSREQDDLGGEDTPVHEDRERRVA